MQPNFLSVIWLAAALAFGLLVLFPILRFIVFG